MRRARGRPHLSGGSRGARGARAGRHPRARADLQRRTAGRPPRRPDAAAERSLPSAAGSRARGRGPPTDGAGDAGSSLAEGDHGRRQRGLLQARDGPPHRPLPARRRHLGAPERTALRGGAGAGRAGARGSVRLRSHVAGGQRLAPGHPQLQPAGREPVARRALHARLGKGDTPGPRLGRAGAGRLPGDTAGLGPDRHRRGGGARRSNADPRRRRGSPGARGQAQRAVGQRADRDAADGAVSGCPSFRPGRWRASGAARRSFGTAGSSGRRGRGSHRPIPRRVIRAPRSDSWRAAVCSSWSPTGAAAGATA